MIIDEKGKTMGDDQFLFLCLYLCAHLYERTHKNFNVIKANNIFPIIV